MIGEILQPLLHHEKGDGSAQEESKHGVLDIFFRQLHNNAFDRSAKDFADTDFLLLSFSGIRGEPEQSEAADKNGQQ